VHNDLCTFFVFGEVDDGLPWQYTPGMHEEINGGKIDFPEIFWYNIIL